MVIKTYLKRPYRRINDNWKLTLIISLFIALFMLLFQPFGLSTYKSEYKSVVLLGYGGVTFIILIVNLFVIKGLFEKWFNNWTIGRQILWLSWVIFTIGTGNYLYSSIIFPMFAGMKGFLTFQVLTLIIGVFPVVIITLVSYNIKLKHNLKTATEVNDLLVTKPITPNTEEAVMLVADNGKDKLELELSDLIYIESAGNYIEAYYYNDKNNDKKISKMLLRGTIKRIEKETQQHTSLIKCHRAFIVNLDHVESMKGNSQELRLQLKNVDIEIPVSRNNSQKMKDSLS